MSEATTTTPSLQALHALILDGDLTDAAQMCDKLIAIQVREKLTPAARDVLAERNRHPDKGYTNDHDDEHVNGEIAAMAALFIMPAGSREFEIENTRHGMKVGDVMLPPHWKYPDLGDRRDQLVKGTAMALAEIERFDRAAENAAQAAAS